MMSATVAVMMLLAIVCCGVDHSVAHKGGGFEALPKHEHTTCIHDDLDHSMARAAIAQGGDAMQRRRLERISSQKRQGERAATGQSSAPHVMKALQNDSNLITEGTWGPITIKWFFDPYDCETETCGHCIQAGQMVHTYRGDNPRVTTIECLDTDILRATQRDFVASVVMSQAVQRLQAALLVRKDVAPPLLKVAGPDKDFPRNCGLRQGVRAPQEHVTTGVDADLVIYVTATPVPARTEGLIAFATFCQIDEIGRPVVGHINFLPSSIFTIPRQQVIDAAVHEILHILGFGSSVFNTLVFKDPEDGRTKPVLAEIPVRGKPASWIITPQVRTLARSYFGCETLPGLEIEDQGGPGTAGSHWEKRAVFAEGMCGVRTTSHVAYSQFTYAFLEDTGWYRANFAVSDPMDWGRGKGCRFIYERCSNLTDLREFCFGLSRFDPLCTFWHERGYCDVFQYNEDIAAHFRYFTSNPRQAGGIPTADYCPVTRYFSSGDCTDTDNAIAGEERSLGIVFGPRSNCFVSSATHRDFRQMNVDTRCFPFRCAANRIEILIGRDYYNCPDTGEAATLDLSGDYRGIVRCPRFDTLCASRVLPNVTKELVVECSFRGYLDLFGACVCLNDFLLPSCKYHRTQATILRLSSKLSLTDVLSGRLMPLLAAVTGVDLVADPDALHFLRAEWEFEPPPPLEFLGGSADATDAPLTPAPAPLVYIFVELRSFSGADAMIRAIGRGIALKHSWAVEMRIVGLDLHEVFPHPGNQNTATIGIPMTSYRISSDSALFLLLAVLGSAVLLTAEWLMNANNIE